jgi:hypothetical protein
VMTHSLARRSTRNRSCWMSWTPGTRRWSRMGSLGQFLRESPGSIRSRAKPSFAHAHVPLKHVWHTRVASCRTIVLGYIEAPPSSSRLTAAFAPQLLLPTRLAVTVTFDLPPLLPACCPSCTSRASELVSSTRPLLHHQRSPGRS